MKFLISLGFMIIDFITGVTGAWKNKKLNSSVMRNGMFNKCGSMIMITLGYLVDYAQRYIDLGFNLDLATPICVYIIIMEILSIIENVGELNPNILPNKIREIFEKL